MAKRWYEVFIDMGDEGTMTLENFGTKKEAVEWKRKYKTKHPKAKLYIDSLTFNMCRY